MAQDVKRMWSTIVSCVVHNADRSQLCRSYVCVEHERQKASSVPHLQGPEYQSPNCMIWEAARATSATPTFFERLVINEEPFIDGGMGGNNPIHHVFQEAQLMFPDRHIACIVSIGTGQAETISIPKPDWTQRAIPLDVVDAMRKIATDCEASAQDAAQRFEHTPGIYFRFNVDQGLQDVGLEQWDKLDEVRAHTGQYIQMVDVNPRLKDVVVAICGRPSVVPTTHISTDVSNLC